MSPRLLLTILAGLVLSASLSAEEKKDDPGDLARWIKQLGSPRFRERETAMTALVKQRSPQALAHLRLAARHGDLEVRRRAQEVLDAVERLLETEQALQPLKLRLDFKDVPLADAEADFARRSGLKIELADSDKAKLASRKVTLETGEVSVWEALRQLCLKAGVNERPPEAEQRRPEPWEELGGRRRVVWRHREQMQELPEQRIILADGGAARPMFQAGSLRIQALPRAPFAGPPAPYAALTLAIDVDPRYVWGRLVSIRIDEAADEMGQKLIQPELTIGDVPKQPQNLEELFIIWDGMSEMPRVSPRQGAVKLRLGTKPAKLVKEMRGRLAAEVEVPPAPLITVNAILDSGGKTFTGPEGSHVKVIEAKRDESGQYKLRVEVKLPPDPNQMPAFGNMIWLNRGPVPAGGTVDLTAGEVEQKGLSIHDADGQPFLLASAHYDSPAKPNDPRVYTLYYQPRKGQGDPVRFTLRGKRTVLLEVPFVLKDVPLP